jgi:hypothetical protein
MLPLFIVLVFLVLFLLSRSPSSRDRDVIPHVDAFHFVDALLDDALYVSLYITHTRRPHTYLGANTHRPASTYPHPGLDALRAQLCQILRGRSIFLVGPHETLYQLHSFLLAVLRPDTTIPARASCPASPSLSSSCPSHPLCHPIIKSRPPPLNSGASSDSGSAFGFGSGPGFDAGYEALTPDISSTNGSGSGSNSSTVLRFLHSGNLNPQGDVRLSVPSVDPRTGVRVIDSRWVRHAASSKASILVLNRGPLPAPAWSYHDASESSARNLTWLTTLRALEQEHTEPLSDLFADVLSRLDRRHHHESNTKELVINAALHSTVSTFLPSLLSTLSKLREHTGHRAILGGKKPVLWYGSWFLPVSCAPESLSVFAPSAESDPWRLLVRLLAQAEAMDNPWSAYYNAQGLYDKKCALLASPCLNLFLQCTCMTDSLHGFCPHMVCFTFLRCPQWPNLR